MVDAKIYVPGQWYCAKCDFRLFKSNMDAETGIVEPSTGPSEPCPNCSSPLWRVSWEQHARDGWKAFSETFEELQALKGEESDMVCVNKASLLDVVRKLDFGAHIPTDRFNKSFDDLRSAFTPDEIALGLNNTPKGGA